MYRIVTYNVRRCLGTDGRVEPKRIAEVIASCDPHVVALQELDVRRARTGRIDQAEAIAAALGMELHFHPALRVFEEEYGDAILTTRPSRLVKAGPLPAPLHQELEPRGALWVTAQIGGRPCEIVNTHLGLRGMERLIQVDALLGPDWIGSALPSAPLMLVGDLNAVPSSRAYRRIAQRLRDAQSLSAGRPRPTFPSRLPFLRLDHVFVNGWVEVLRVETIRTPLARVASDHLPLFVEFGLVPGASRNPGTVH
ncbi:endonuclease/exonuclease/phosphatase family protein [Enterovirga aerilata]|uniref:EEP domain-containing protein n=1 Tax=Enterovirga aerilata TaxID=2730920 RepID=A0A849I3U4_9HYPH|nr:EEP domain-containing protein [Enterovirga sp. DB1703]